MPVKDQEYQWHDRVHGNVKCDASVIWVKEGPDPFHRFLRTPLLSAWQKLELSLNITTHDSQAERSLVQILKHLSTESCTRCSPHPFLKQEANTVSEPNLPPPSQISFGEATCPVCLRLHNLFSLFQNAAAWRWEIKAGRGAILHSRKEMNYAPATLT